MMCEPCCGELADLVDGGLAGPRRAAAEAHLIACARCRRLVRAVRAVDVVFAEARRSRPRLPRAADILARARRPSDGI